MVSFHGQRVLYYNWNIELYFPLIIMAFDFDRYLFASDTSCIDSLLIQKAYTEWTSYCYMAYAMCSGAERSPSNPPAVSSRDSRYTSNTGRPGADNTYNKTYVGGDPTTKNDVPLQDAAVHAQIQNGIDRHRADDVSRDSHCTQPPLRVSTVDGHGVVCHCSASNPIDDIAVMPRPPGYEFGSRLAWMQDNDIMPSHGRVGTARCAPALGLSGLKCQGTLNGSVTRSPKRGIETFPKCATAGKLRASQSMHGLSGYTSRVLSKTSSIECEEFTKNIRDLCQTGRTSEMVTTRRTSIVTSSKVVLTSMDSVIDECSSSDEEISIEIPPPPQPEVLKQRTRKVMFADERGAELVTCRVYERESSPLGICISIDLDSDDAGDGSDLSCDESDNLSSSKSIKFGILADAATRTVSKDIDNLKKLIEKHRTYFDSFKPRERCDNRDEVSDKSIHKVVTSSGDQSNDEALRIATTREINYCKFDRSENGTLDDVIDNSVPRITSPVPETLNCSFMNFDSTSLPEQTYILSGWNIQLTDLKFNSKCGIISGHVTLRSVSYHKIVFVRYTTDNWRSQDDVPAYYVNTKDIITSRDLFDTFKFQIEPFAGHSSRDHDGQRHWSEMTMELATCYKALDTRCEFWDNNGGENYKLLLCA